MLKYVRKTSIPLYLNFFSGLHGETEVAVLQPNVYRWGSSIADKVGVAVRVANAARIDFTISMTYRGGFGDQISTVTQNPFVERPTLQRLSCYDTRATWCVLCFRERPLRASSTGSSLNSLAAQH